MRRPPTLRFVGFIALTSATLLPSCSDGSGPPGPPNPPAPAALEEVPHAALGNVRVAFERLSPTGGVYWVDGGSGNRGASPIGLATDPAISPDGRRIAFRALSSFQTSWDVYVADVDGGGRQQLSAEVGNAESGPTWAHDGAVVWAVYFNPVRFVRNAAGAVQPATLASVPPSPPMQYCPYYTSIDGPPSMSPAGELLFVCNRRGIYRLVPSGQPVLVHMRPENADDWIRHAAWSPTGDRIAFLSHRYTEHSMQPGHVRVFVLDATGGEPALVTEHVVPAGSAQFGNAPRLTLCWAGSSHIVFAAPTGQFTAHIFAASIAGGAAIQVTTAAGVSDGSVSCSRTAF